MNLRKRYRQIAALAFAAFLTGCGNEEDFLYGFFCKCD